MGTMQWPTQASTSGTFATSSIPTETRQSELSLIRDETERLAHKLDQFEALLNPILTPKYDTEHDPQEPAPLMSEIMQVRFRLSSCVDRIIGLAERVEV